jgi:hypothetical protein
MIAIDGVHNADCRASWISLARGHCVKWLPTLLGGWFDLDNGVLYRTSVNARQSRKRQPPARIHAKLLPHLRRWRAMDMAHGITVVVHYQGEEIAKLRRSWGGVARLAGATRKDGPHIMRHTAGTLADADGQGYLSSGWLPGHKPGDALEGLRASSSRLPIRCGLRYRKAAINKIVSSRICAHICAPMFRV